MLNVFLSMVTTTLQGSQGQVIDPDATTTSVSVPARLAGAPEIDSFLSLHMRGRDSTYHLETLLLRPETGGQFHVNPPVLPDPPDVPGSYPFESDVSWNPRERSFLVVWREYGGPRPPYTFTIMGRVLSETGLPVGPEIPVSPVRTVSLDSPRVASDGAGWLVLWKEGYVGLQCSLVTRAGGTVSAGAMRSLVLVNPATEHISGANVAAVAGGGYLAVWGNGPAAYARPVDSSGEPGAGTSTIMTGIPAVFSEIALASDSITGQVAAAVVVHPSSTIVLRRVGRDGVATGPQIWHAPSAPALLVSNVSLVHLPASHEFVLSYFTSGIALEMVKFNGPDFALNGGALHPLTAVPLSTSYRTISSAARAGLPGVVVQFMTEASSVHALEVLSVDVGVNPKGPSIVAGSMVQLQASGAAAEEGAQLADRRIRLGAQATDSDSPALEFQVELKPVSAPFNGQGLTILAGVATAQTASVEVDLAPGEHYHWRIRFVDPEKIPSPWKSFGGNEEAAADFIAAANRVPSTPDAGQARVGSGDVAEVGFVEGSDQGIRIEGRVDDGDGDAVRLEVEVRRLGIPFEGTATASSGFVPAGGTARIDLVGIEGSFHWQSRTVDSLAASSPWTPFGGNGEGEADFRVLALGSGGLDASCLQSAGGAVSMLALLPVLALIRRR